MNVGSLPDGTRGIDANSRLDEDAVRAFLDLGFKFAVRYVRRASANNHDLTKDERDIIIGCGMGLMVVQHVAQEGWIPSPDLGAQYGDIAVEECNRAGIPAEVSLWCDLEGVKHGVPHDQTIGFCNRWYDATRAPMYQPGLYLGDSYGLTPTEVYWKLKFRNFWSAYNLNRDQFPVVRGVQMKQAAARSSEFVPGFDNQNMDVDIIKTDALGRSPSLLLP